MTEPNLNPSISSMTNEERERLIDEACQRAIAEGKNFRRFPVGDTCRICPMQALAGYTPGYTYRAAAILKIEYPWVEAFECGFDGDTPLSEAAALGKKFAEKYL